MCIAILKSVYQNIIYRLSEQAGKDKSFAEDLWERISHSQGVLMELAYYHDKGDFWDKHVVAGYHLTDIIVWQVDHFKAFLDRGDDMNKYNECEMILKAFDTFMKMKANPEKYIRMISEESGSDYDGKF